MNPISTTSGRVSKKPVLYADVQDVSSVFSVRDKQRKVTGKVQKPSVKKIQDNRLLFML